MDDSDACKPGASDMEDELRVERVTPGCPIGCDTSKRLRAALAELVRLKDLKDKRLQSGGVTWDHPEDKREYERRKPEAWAEARRLLEDEG